MKGIRATAYKYGGLHYENITLDMSRKKLILDESDNLATMVKFIRDFLYCNWKNAYGRLEMTYNDICLYIEYTGSPDAWPLSISYTKGEHGTPILLSTATNPGDDFYRAMWNPSTRSLIKLLARYEKENPKCKGILNTYLQYYKNLDFGIHWELLLTRYDMPIFKGYMVNLHPEDYMSRMLDTSRRVCKIITSEDFLQKYNAYAVNKVKSIKVELSSMNNNNLEEKWIKRVIFDVGDKGTSSLEYFHSHGGMKIWMDERDYKFFTRLIGVYMANEWKVWPLWGDADVTLSLNTIYGILCMLNDVEESNIGVTEYNRFNTLNSTLKKNNMSWDSKWLRKDFELRSTSNRSYRDYVRKRKDALKRTWF